MLKEKILSLGCMLLMGVAFTSCNDSDAGDDIFPQEKFPLTAFAVKVDNTYYHGKIDQETRRVEIGAIEDAMTITDVDYELENDSAKIAPNPAEFIGKWKKEQTVTVTTENKQEITYTICLTKFKEKEDATNPAPYPNMTLLFEENFDVDGNPDDTKWILCQKAGSDWNDEMSESYDQAFVRDGNLVLQAIKDGDTYKAGGIETRTKFGFTFGKVEVRAKISKYPNGAFPAIWMMPQKYIYQGWPNCGEVDIMEHVKQEAHIHHTIHSHYRTTLGHNDPTPTTQVTCNFEEYVLYGLEWTPDELKFFVNGKETLSYPNLKLDDEATMQQWPFTKDSEFYLILNMGLGGDRQGSWAGPIDDANLPAEMLVDWVRVYANEFTVEK